MSRILSLVTILIFSTGTLAGAASITWKIEGQVNNVDVNLTSQFSIGDELTAFLTFDTETPDTEPWISYRGNYDNAASMVVSMGGYTASADQMYITVLNDFDPDGRDQFVTSSTHESNAIGADVGSYHFGGFNMSLRDNDGNMFSSIDLPEVPPLSSLVDAEFLYLNFYKPIATNINLGESVSVANLDFRVVPPTPVPEPSTMLLFGSSLLGLTGLRRMFKK